jgi:plastocyanin
VSSRVLTPTLIICCAGAIAGGIALARPASVPARTAQPTAVVTSASAKPDAGGAYGRPAPSTTAARRGTTSRASGAGGGGSAVSISGFSFGSPLTVGPGATVAVRNRDSAPHTVTGRGFDSGTVNGGASGSFTAPTAPGTYSFSCEIHPSMSGSLTVRS